MAIFRNRQTRSKAEVAATIVGGGISEVRSVLDLTDAGLKIFLVEHFPCPGRHVTQLGLMLSWPAGVLRRSASDHGYRGTRSFVFPVCIDHNQQLNIDILTKPRVIGVEGQAGDLAVLRRRGQHQESSQCCTS